MPTLELINTVTTKPLGSTMTLEDGKLTFEGDGVKEIAAVFMDRFPPETVFKNLTNWSNGYLWLRPKKES